jgi:hypothetical protein
MPWTTPITPAPAATATSSGVGAAVDLGVCTTAVLDLIVSAVSGTSPTLTVSIETSKDSVVWRPLGAFPAVAAAGVTGQRFPGADRYVRAVWAIGGTAPSFTFAVAGDAALVYVTPRQFDEMSIRAEALEDYSDSDKDKWIAAACDDADGLLEGGPYALPLAKWGDDLRQRIVNRATYYGMRHRGFNPAKDGPDYLVVKDFDQAWEWFEDVRDEKVILRGVDATPQVYDGGAGVVSRPKRGWGR